MAINAGSEFLNELARFYSDVKRAPGDTIEERLDHVLSARGWDKELDKIGDDFRIIVRQALERTALGRQPLENPRDIEKDRQRKEREKAASTGVYGDLFADQYLGFEPRELASKLPCEQYFVPSLGVYVPREELAFRLDAVAELRKQSQIELLRIEQVANVYRHELAIFDELLRRGNGTNQAAEFEAADR